jgi:hypothetical protein
VGMPNITFRCQMFRGDWDQVWSQLRMLWLMEALCRVNQTHLRQFETFKKRGLVARGYPALYRSGLHYETEKGTEIWPDIPSLLSGTMGRGLHPGHWGDCEDLACYRVAELRCLPWHYERRAPWDPKKTEVADPRFPQPRDLPKVPLLSGRELDPWRGWRKVDGGVRAKPFAKWRRGPRGNYHYHALTYLPDGRLEDPSLVLGMGREKEFAAAKTAEKLRDGAPVVILYAEPPEVMVVDPEKPSGYGGGRAPELDEKVLRKLRKSGVSGGDDPEVGAYLNNEVLLGETEFDVDAEIGWSRSEGRFDARSEASEYRRLLGYANH